MEEVLGNLQRANTALLEAQGALRGSGSLLRFIQERVEEVRDASSLPGASPGPVPVRVPLAAERAQGGLGCGSLLTRLAVPAGRGCARAGPEECGGRGGRAGRAGRASLAAAARR